MDEGRAGGSEWQPAVVKSEPACENEEIEDPKVYSGDYPQFCLKTDPSTLLESKVLSSVDDVPLGSRSSDAGQDASVLTHQLKMEIIEEEDKNSLAGTYPDTRGEVPRTTIAETGSGVHLESSVFCSVQGLPLVDESASSALTLVQQVKVEKIKDEDLTGDAYPDNRGEVLSKTVQETGSGIYLEPSVFCSVQDLPSADVSASSASYDAPTLMQRVKVEIIEDDNLSAEYPDSNQHFSSGPQSSSIPEDTSILPEDVNPKVKHDLTEETDTSKYNQQIYFAQTNSETNDVPPENMSFTVSTDCDGFQFGLHTDDPSVSCSVAGNQIKHVKKVDAPNHMKSPLNKKPYSSEQCSETFVSTTNSKSLDSTLSKEKRFCCEKCPAKFTRKDVLKKHLLIHSDEKMFSCSQCSSKFKRKDYLTIHLLSHSNEKSFSCPQCSVQFKQKSHLQSHLLTHANKKAWPCDQCPARFNHKSDLKRHLVTHSNEKTFFCNLCSARFSQKSILKEHMVVHSDEKPFSCDQCSALFKRKSDLRNHSLVHSNEKTLSCPQCSEKFKRRGNLRSHLLSHSEERFFSCHQCLAKFKDKGSLKTHLLVHSNEKPFPCDQCSAKFKRKADLVRHYSNHLKKPPIFNSELLVKSETYISSSTDCL